MSESNDFDASKDELFDFFQGKVESVEKSSGPGKHELSDEGYTIRQVDSFHFVNTDKQRYFFLLEYYPNDTKNPDNKGLYLILVMKAEDKKIYDDSQNILFDGDKELSHVGIYIPIK